MIAESVNNLTSDDYKKMYSMMLTSRLFTQKVLELNKQGILKVGLHPSTGQEAIGIGACYGLSKDDWVIPSLRTMEAFWAKGVTVLDQLNAVIGNSGSISDGKESFHHCGYPELGIMAGSSIVGSQVPVAAGIGLSLKNKNANNIWSNDLLVEDTIYLILLFIPIIMVITLNSTLYNGWRHLYFIYPVFLLISIKGFDFLNAKVFKEKIIASGQNASRLNSSLFDYF